METIFSSKSETISRIYTVIYEVRLTNFYNKSENDFVDRYLRVWYKLKRAKRRAHMDFINPVPLQQIYGKDIKCFIV